MSEISIWPRRKTWFCTWWQIPCRQSQRSDVSCSWPPGLHTSQEGFCPTPLQVIMVSRLKFGNSNLQLPPQIFYGMKVWRLARLLQDLIVLLLEPLFCCLAMCFVSFLCWNTRPRPIFNSLAGFNALALSIVSSMQSSWPVPLAEQHLQTFCFHLQVWRWVWCSWSHRQDSSSSKHGEMRWRQRAGLWSHLTTTLSPSSPLNHWQTSDGPVHVLSWAGRPSRRCRISVLYGVVCCQFFSWWLWSQLPWDHWQDPLV